MTPNERVKELTRWLVAMPQAFLGMSDEEFATALLAKQDSMERTKLAARDALIAEQREQLVLCFAYLGKEIERLPLNESAESGVQSLSRTVAAVLDKPSP